MVSLRNLVHYSAGKLEMKTGPNNPLVRAMMRRRCRPLALEFKDDYIDVSSNSRTIRFAASHFLFVYDMVKYFEVYFNQVVPEKGGAGLLVDYSRPKVHRYKNGLDFELSSFPEELEAMEGYFHWYKPAPSDLIFDIGAYCGVTAYHLSKQVPQGKVYCFEPDPMNFSLLSRNIERHGLKNVTPVPCAISDKTGEASFLSEGTLGSRLERHAPRMTLGGVQSVPTLTLADACVRYGVPSFVKVDIEGTEIEMLAAATPFLKANRMEFAIDTNHRINGSFTAPAVEEILRSCGYRTESGTAGGFLTTWAAADTRPKR